jgi:ABC-type spermidine/putrescine transport system permease subunit II
MPTGNRILFARWSPLALTAGLFAVAAVVVSDRTASDQTAAMLVNSGLLAAGATIVALPRGIWLAVGIGRLDLPGKRLAAACIGGLL